MGVPNEAIAGNYSDPNHPGGFRTIEMNGAVASIQGVDGFGAQPWTLVGKVTGNSVRIDFSPKGGPKDLQGQFDGSGIVFSDGNRWSKQLLKFHVLQNNSGEGG